MIIETIAEKLALRMLAETGDAVIQNALIAAAAARAAGRGEVAAALVEIAEAAERLCAARASALHRVTFETGLRRRGQPILAHSPTP